MYSGTILRTVSPAPQPAKSMEEQKAEEEILEAAISNTIEKYDAACHRKSSAEQSIVMLSRQLAEKRGEKMMPRLEDTLVRYRRRNSLVTSP